MTTAMQQLNDLYAQKRADGLVDVKFDLNGKGRSATSEQIAQEVLNMQAAIDAGHTKPLDFGDLRLTPAKTDGAQH
jgi:hypothetical protein